MPTTLAQSSSVGNDQSSDMKIDSKPAALSFKLPQAGQQEIRPPLTPATEVDLQKSCAILVQSTGYSRSFKNAVNSTAMMSSQRRGNGTMPVTRSHGRTPSKAGSRTPVGRVAKPGGGSGGHRRGGSSTAGYAKTSASSKYVPPRRPAPEKALPVARRVKMKNEDKGVEEEEVVKERAGSETRSIEKNSKVMMDKERKSSDGSSMEDASRTEKNKMGVKKLVTAMTGYIRPHDSSSQLEAQSSPISNAEDSSCSPSREKSTIAGTLQVKSSRRRDGTTYVEALPEHLHTKAGSDEERRHGELKRSVSKRLGYAMKEYVKPPHVDRFTPEPLHTASTTSSKEEQKKADQKKHRVTKAMREYVRPSPIDISHAAIAEEGASQAPKPEKTPKSAKSQPAVSEKPTSPITKDTQKPSPTTTTDPQKSPIDATLSKPPQANSHGHHNPFRLIHNYVKPSRTDPALTLQTNIPQAPTHFSPVLPSERKPLTPQNSQPSMPYVPPKIRPRGQTIPSENTALSMDTVVPTLPPVPRQGPIFGGGYPVKQQQQDASLGVPTSPKDKENRGPVSPGFFGRNPAGGGFRIHFSHFLNKQRGDGHITT
ncbi:hypothetical protein TWF730_003228 [Orbilia blumenaviensis]|uniref:Uncharacterized protein n=1 Tax=Orbilia blumenaviensis TaxID=1796055 RepID=A0AAV9U7D0_9PEZI